MAMPEAHVRRIRTGIWYLTWRFVGVLVLAMGVHVGYAVVSGQGAKALRDTLREDLAHVRVLDRSGHAYARARRWAHAAYTWVYERSGFNDMIRRFADPRGLNPIDTELRKVIVHYWPEIRASMVSVQILGERLAMLASTWPLVALLAVVAIADGWMAWSLRRAFAARESAFLYHRLKRGFFVTIVIMWLVYLTPPTPMYPQLLVAFVAAAAILLRMTLAYFKKYV
ncbi:MAG: DUF4400 domain-containing protein [Deltaproteobacteria bacterium]|nr:MAG: DUF4400 domain-containing protein [Deltaproteobacteria bacterium]